MSIDAAQDGEQPTATPIIRVTPAQELIDDGVFDVNSQVVRELVRFWE